MLKYDKCIVKQWLQKSHSQIFVVWPALFRHSHARRCFLLEIGAMNVVYVKEFKHAELFSKVWGEIAFVKGK